jgi:hypothetical protein
MRYDKVTTNRYMVISDENQFVCWIEKIKTGYSVDYIVSQKSFSFDSLQEAKDFIEKNLTRIY